MESLNKYSLYFWEEIMKKTAILIAALTIGTQVIAHPLSNSAGKLGTLGNAFKTPQQQAAALNPINKPGLTYAGEDIAPLPILGGQPLSA
jgi:hypothetical protein